MQWGCDERYQKPDNVTKYSILWLLYSKDNSFHGVPDLTG